MTRTELPALTFESLSGLPGLVHGVFPRQGGISGPPFDSLNVSYSTGDDPCAVLENRCRILAWLGLGRALFLNQVHGSEILALDAADACADTRADTGANTDLFWTGQGPPPSRIVEADGVVTNLTDLALVIQVADCQSVMLVDPETGTVANVHSGWRGSLADITGRCVDVMTGKFGCDPARIRAGISPSLGPCCGEFINYRDEIPDRFWRYKAPDRDYFDFWAMTRDQLTEKGVLTANIETMGLCSRCRPDLFFSYRNARKTGRFACVIGLEQGR